MDQPRRKAHPRAGTGALAAVIGLAFMTVPSSAHAAAEQGAAQPATAAVRRDVRARADIELHFRIAPLLSYASFWGGGAIMTLPFGASLNMANPLLGRSGKQWFSVHASVFGPGINWTGIKNARPFYPSVLGAISVGPRLSWMYLSLPDGDPKAADFESDRHIVSLDLSLIALATGELLYEPTPSSSKGPISAGLAIAATWVP